ncbi:MAG: hypothetical protein HFJ29_07025 [Clostridia bacterium]|nr:hypothetical protein [Clostridia bacterium]
MAYSELLRNAIASTNYTQEEIARECTKLGVKRNKAQINNMVNGRLAPSNDEISKALAKVCGIDERLLILEHYFDNAPVEIKEIFATMKYLTFLSTSNALANRFPKEILEELKRQLEEQPLSDFAIELLDNGKVYIEQYTNGIKVTSEDNQVVLNTGVVGFPVKDDAMFPILPKGSKAIIEIKEKYANNDIVILRLKDTKDYLIRRIFYLGRQIILMADNKQFEQITKNQEDVTILGKVDSLITKI